MKNNSFINNSLVKKREGISEGGFVLLFNCLNLVLQDCEFINNFSNGFGGSLFILNEEIPPSNFVI